MNTPEQDGEKNHSGIETLVQGNTAFALELYQKLRKEEGDLFFSPYSISTALAMTFAGAQGETESQMAQTMHFLLEQEQLHPAFALLEMKLDEIGKQGQVLLKVANSLWPQEGYPLLEEFLELTKRFYGVLITAVDYGNTETSRCTINAWVEEKTEGKILDLIPSGTLDSMTLLVLVNAIYFKGNWSSQFNKDRTREESFWVTPDKQVQVPMMRQLRKFGYAERDGLQILELPYAGDDLSMILLLPRKKDGLSELEESLTVENLSEWTGKLWYGEVQVYLPRFSTAFPFRLDDTLMSMGMIDAFREADFSGMDETKVLKIGAVLHKAFIDVNEEGTEAAAATAVAMRMKGLPPPTPTFHADHPFVFLIREKSTESILFLGRVVDPS
jgi:serpin B